MNPVLWLNPNLEPVEKLTATSLNLQSIHKAEQLWQRFAPFLQKEFPQTREANGIIESPLKEIAEIKESLGNMYDFKIKGKLYLKCDNSLPIAGSIKARGGFFEVLSYAETLASKAGLLTGTDNYEIFASETFRNLFQQHSIGVGSTGNLGLSIGIMAAQLGFKTSVYMSRDAKQWKKDLLRDKGAQVHEFEGDFSKAIASGREKTMADPKGYFVDDENSEALFLGYSTAALRLKKQLDEKGIRVDREHPLFVYLPCGVGGSPGGITFGLKQVFGDHVHSFFVEPVHSPSVLIGLVTGEMEKVSVQDFGIDNRTEADGLAVGRPSEFATAISDRLVSGIYTVADPILFQLLSLTADKEGIQLEPSATAGLIGPYEVLQSDYIERQEFKQENVNHIVWATGGGLVPEKEMEQFYRKGKELLGY
ncbi:D-serine ammonia-lyase [Virgibacillus ainsalahensis]